MNGVWSGHMGAMQSAGAAREPRIKQVEWNGLVWADIERPSSEETEILAQRYPFHPLDLDDCLSRTQRPKIDHYEDYLFVILHFPVFNKEARATMPSQVSIFIGKGYLITLHSGELKPLVKLFKDCQLREAARQDSMKSPGYLLYRIVDRLTDYCFPILNKIMENIERTEDDIFDSRRRGPVKEISLLRRDIISFRRIIWPLRAVIGALEHRTERFTKQDLEVYWGDVVDHMDKIWDTLDECKEIIEGLSDTSNSLYSHRTNEVIRILTVITTIMLPLTLVASVYGMNIRLPGQSGEGSWVAFIVLLVVMATLGLIMLSFFRYRRWI